MVKRVLIYLAVLLVCAVNGLLLPVSAAGDNPVPRAKQGVVRIYSGIYFDGNDHVQVYDDGYASGTGFAIGAAGTDSSYFLTNCHVVSDGNWETYETVYIALDGSSVGNRSSLVPCEVVYADPHVDLAVICASSPIKGVPPLVLSSQDSIQTGEHVYALGFPGIADAITGSADSSAEDITVTDGILSRKLTGKDNIAYLAHTADVNHGNSGGPLINDAGAVVGINTQIRIDAETTDIRFYAIPIDYATEVLDALSIDYCSESDGSAGGSQQVVLLAAAAGGVLVLGAGVLMWFRSRSGRRSGSPAAEKIHYTLISADLGQSWQVTKPLRIGRDPSGDIVFPAATNGVSRVHCRIEPDGDSVLVTDAGSAYGTIVRGQKLPPHYPVRISGDAAIFLGSNHVALMLRKAGKGGSD